MATPDTRALTILHEAANGPAEAFIDDHEFCHVHPLPEGSLHVTLPNPARQLAIELGWAEEHPLAALGGVPETVVLVYAPRDDRELESVLYLVELSRAFAEGESPLRAGRL